MPEDFVVSSLIVHFNDMPYIIQESQKFIMKKKIID
jgi:hypothetical protein